MSDTTDEVMAIAREISRDQCGRELDDLDPVADAKIRFRVVAKAAELRMLLLKHPPPGRKP